MQQLRYVLTQLISVSNFRNQTPDAQTGMSSDCMCVYLHEIRGALDASHYLLPNSPDGSTNEFMGLAAKNRVLHRPLRGLLANRRFLKSICNLEFPPPPFIYVG